MRFQSTRYRKLFRYGVPRYVRIYDNEGTSTESADRYTVVFSGNYKGREHRCFGLGMSGAPYHPQGFCQHFEYDHVIDYPKYGHLGKKIKFYQLPVDCRMAVIDDYLSVWGLGCPICREMDGIKWKFETVNDDVRLICSKGHKFSIQDFSSFKARSKWERFTQIARAYEPEILSVLGLLKKGFVNENYQVSDVCEEDMYDGGFRWSFQIFVNGSPEEMKEKDVDVSFTILDSEESDGEKNGLNFSLDMVEYGGRRLGGFTPYNFTNNVWVDVKDNEAIMNRFNIVKRNIFDSPYEYVKVVLNALKRNLSNAFSTELLPAARNP